MIKCGREFNWRVTRSSLENPGIAKKIQYKFAVKIAAQFARVEGIFCDIKISGNPHGKPISRPASQSICHYIIIATFLHHRPTGGISRNHKLSHLVQACLNNLIRHKKWAVWSKSRFRFLTATAIEMTVVKTQDEANYICYTGHSSHLLYTRIDCFLIDGSPREIRWEFARKDKSLSKK